MAFSVGLVYAAQCFQVAPTPMRSQEVARNEPSACSCSGSYCAVPAMRSVGNWMGSAAPSVLVTAMS